MDTRIPTLQSPTVLTGFDAADSASLGKAQDLLAEEEGELECNCLPWELCGGAPLIVNEGSTARDYLARERNWLSEIKLAVTLSVISAALLLRFQFGNGEPITVPGFQINASKPLAILFFVAAAATLLVGVSGYYRYQHDMVRQVAFISQGWIGTTVIWTVGALTLATCVLLLVADSA